MIVNRLEILSRQKELIVLNRAFRRPVPYLQIDLFLFKTDFTGHVAFSLNDFWLKGGDLHPVVEDLLDFLFLSDVLGDCEPVVDFALFVVVVLGSDLEKYAEVVLAECYHVD